MRLTPSGIHREVLRRCRTRHSDDPTWYAVWLGYPHAEGSVLLGRTERLPRPRWWRVHPATGEFPRAVRGWTSAIGWLLEMHEGHERTSDTASSDESEHVGISLRRCAVLDGSEPAGDLRTTRADGSFEGKLMT